MLQPLRGKILVEILPDSQRTESGLYLAGIKEEIPHRGRVVSLGAPYRDRKQREFPWGFQVGHIVHFKRVWDQNKVKHYILKREQIFAIEYEDKAYAFGEHVIVKKLNEVGGSLVFVPAHFESEVAKETGLAEVLSVGRDDKLGLKVGERILCYKNEGLKVSIPLQSELWSLKARAILGKVE